MISEPLKNIPWQEGPTEFEGAPVWERPHWLDFGAIGAPLSCLGYFITTTRLAGRPVSFTK